MTDTLVRRGVPAIITVVVLFGFSTINLFSDPFPQKYGTLRVPGAKVIHFKPDTIYVAYAVLLPGSGNETPNVPLPAHLDLSVTPTESGAPAATVIRDLGGNVNSAVENTDTSRRVWKVTIPQEGDYRVRVTGGSFVAVNATLAFGTGPLVPRGYIWLAIGLIGVLVFFRAEVWRLVRRPFTRGAD